MHRKYGGSPWVVMPPQRAGAGSRCTGKAAPGMLPLLEGAVNS